MTKTVAAPMRTHIDQEVTALCTCWIIEREDGTIVRLTDHDEDVTVGADTYEAVGGYKRTAITSTDTLSVDNLDIEGLSGDIILPREDLVVGLYDNAKVKIFVTRWDGGTASEIKVRHGRFGAVQVMPNGTFVVEVRGLMQYLNHTFTDIYTTTCLRQFGDSGCTVPAQPSIVQKNTVYAVDDGIINPPKGDTYNLFSRDAWFQDGSIDTSSGWYKYSVATLDISGALTTSDSITFDDGTNTPTTLVANTDFTAGVNAATDLTELVDAVNAAANLDLIGYLKDSDATLKLSGALTSGDSITFDDGTNTPTTLVGGTDFTVGVSAAADATALHTAINAAASLDISSSDDTNGRLTLTNTLTTPGAITINVDSGGVMALVDFTRTATFYNALTSTGDITINTDSGSVLTLVNFVGGTMTVGTGPAIGAFNGSNCLIGGSTDAIVAQDFPLLASGVPLASIDAGACVLDFWFWRLGNTNTGRVTVEALDASYEPLGILYDTGEHDPATLAEWVKKGVKQAAIPANTRFIRAKVYAILTGSPPIVQYFDNFYGWIVDTSGSGYQTSPYLEWVWKCTVGGSTQSGTLIFPEGAVGEVHTQGASTWEAEEGIKRGASVISVTPGSSRVFRAEPQEYRAVDGWFNGGVVEWITGANAGGKMEVKSWVRDGSPTATSIRTAYYAGSQTGGGVGEVGFFGTDAQIFVDWNRGAGGIAYIRSDANGGTYVADEMWEWDLSTMNYNGVTHDLTTLDTDMDFGAQLCGIDRDTGKLYGEHQYFAGNSIRYVYDPITLTYDTYLSVTPSASDMGCTGYTASVCIKNISTGTKRTLSISAYDGQGHTIRVHAFPAMTNHSIINPPLPTMEPSALCVDDTNTIAWNLWIDSNTMWLYKYTVDGSGNIVSTKIGDITVSDVEGSAFTVSQEIVKPRYDPVTDQLIVNQLTDAGAYRFLMAFDATTGDVSWISEAEWYLMDGWTDQQHNLNGKYFIVAGIAPHVDEFIVIADITTGEIRKASFGALPTEQALPYLFIWNDVSGFGYWGEFYADLKLHAYSITTVTIAPGTIELFLSMPYEIEAGDLFTITAGCDKSRLACALLFDNVEHFLGAPDIPGQDDVLSYPDAKS